jgi:hypothetical protein
MEKNNCFVEQFNRLPRRVFLDSSILQTLHNYGEYIWENIAVSENDNILAMTNGLENLEALRKIFFINIRAKFEFAVSRNSLNEVSHKQESSYLQWAYDVLDHWIACIQEYEKSKGFSGKGMSYSRKIFEKKFSYLSDKDRLLLSDAIKLECDAFLTMDEKLWKNKQSIEKQINILILRPLDYWQLLQSFARLYI